jgi:hypothetical protein
MNKTKHIHFLMTPALFVKWSEAAEFYNITRSDYLRLALSHQLARDGFNTIDVKPQTEERVKPND